MKKIFCLIAVLTAMGFAMTGCFGDSSSDDSSSNGDGLAPLPDSDGENELYDSVQKKGKTYYNGDEKIEFNSNGTYVKYEIKEDSSGNDVVGGDNKYEWAKEEEGTYSWNNTPTNKTVTLKWGKVSWEEDDNGNPTNLRDRAGLKSYLDKHLDYNDMAKNTGYSSKSEMLDEFLALAFVNRTYNYAFSGKALFLDEVLQESKGDNELTDKSFGEVGGGNDGINFKKHSEVYTFIDSKNFTLANGDFTNGEYTYDTSKSNLKRISIKANTTGRESYYSGLPTSGDGAPYPNVTAQNAARTNNQFGRSYYGFIYKIDHPTLGNTLIEWP
jgi:hypothetical protein